MAELVIDLDNGNIKATGISQEQDAILQVIQEQQRQHEERMETLLEQQFNKIVHLLGTVSGTPPPLPLLPLASPSPASRFTSSRSRNSLEEIPQSRTIAPQSMFRQSFIPRLRISEQEQVILGAKTAIEQVTAQAHSGAKLQEEYRDSTDRSHSPSEEFEFQQSEQGPIQRYAEFAVHHWTFQLCVMFLIGGSTVGLGLDTEWAAKNQGEEFPHIGTINLCLSTLFFLEIIIRIVAERSYFLSWQNEGILWNLLDSGLVFLSVCEEIWSRAMQESGLLDVSQTRLLRCLRLVKAVRLVRVLRFFQDLRVMVTGILTSMKSLVFALLLLEIIIYMVAVCILQFTVHYMQTHDDETSEILQVYFNDVGDTCYHLFACLTSGLSWIDVGNALFGVHWFLGMVFVFYISFGTLCVLNIITGVFVESAMKNSEADDDQFMLLELEEKQGWIEKVKAAFLEADIDRNGALNLAEFTKFCGQRNMQFMLTKLGVDLCHSTPAQLFRLMDVDDTNLIDVNDFAAGLLSMRGNAKSLDVALLARSIKRIQSDVFRVNQCVFDIHQYMLHTWQI